MSLEEGFFSDVWACDPTTEETTNIKEALSGVDFVSFCWKLLNGFEHWVSFLFYILKSFFDTESDKVFKCGTVDTKLVSYCIKFILCTLPPCHLWRGDILILFFAVWPFVVTYSFAGSRFLTIFLWKASQCACWLHISNKITIRQAELIFTVSPCILIH